MEMMCLYCGKRFEAQKTTAKYCSDSHRALDSRKRRRARAAADLLESKLKLSAELERLARVMPRSAKAAQMVINQMTVNDTQVVFKLIATVVHESRAINGAKS